MHMRFRALEHEEAVVIYQLLSPVQMHEYGDVFAVFIVDELSRLVAISPFRDFVG